jgi:hypothetical protein
MKIKTLIVIIGILAVLSLVAFFARRPKAVPLTDPRVGEAVVPTAQIEKIGRVRITDQGKTVDLKREADGSWRVANYHDLPADFSKLSQFVSSLSEAKLTRFISARPEIISRLQFKDTTIELLDIADKEIATLNLGKTPDSGGRYLCFGSEPRAYLATMQAWLDPEPKSWADTKLLSLKPDEIATLKISTTGDNHVTFSRTKVTESWATQKAPEGKNVNAGKVSSLIGSLSQLRFTDTNEPADEKALAAKQNARTFTLTTFDGKTYTVSFGRKPEEKKLKTPAAQSAPDFTKNSPVNPDGTVKPIKPAKPDLPEFETIPAGPVFVFVTASDEKSPVNALMRKRAFQVAEYIFTDLPQTVDELFEAVPPTTAAPTTPK